MEIHILDWIIYLIIAIIVLWWNDEDSTGAVIATFVFTVFYVIVFAITDWSDIIDWAVEHIDFRL